MVETPELLWPVTTTLSLSVLISQVTEGTITQLINWNKGVNICKVLSFENGAWHIVNAHC